MIRLAFDIGGTFTDFVLHDERSEQTWSLKVSTTTRDPAQAVIAGIEKLLDCADIKLSLVDIVLHATTVAANAIIERKGASTALITTQGFRDILIIGRQKRYETYDLYLDKPRPILRRRDIYEVKERMAFDGRVIEPLDEASVDTAIDAILAAGSRSVAVCLLHAYANPRHERQIHKRIQERAPGLSISLSCDVSPKFREYERTNTTVANAYIKPIVDGYVDRLERSLATGGFRNELFIMQSSGGFVSPALARQYPIRIAESGPAAGVLMCGQVGAAEGFAELVTFDMGGTTAKLGAVEKGKPAIVPTFEIDPVRYKKGSGLPINVPSVELLEIGAGGGSIARTEMGMIIVGPESAGAEPGPACYGRGGRFPTVTDANVVLGYIDPSYFNGGSMRLDQMAAQSAIERVIARPLGISIGEGAWGVHLIATSNMEHAMRVVSVERGRDPRRCALVAFGGAGPIHAARLARAVGLPTVIVPFGAGVGSAIGLLQADAHIDVSVTRVMIIGVDEDIAALYTDLESRALRDLAHLGSGHAPKWSRYAYMRYAGQGFEIYVSLPDGEIKAGYAAKAIEAFHASHRRLHHWNDKAAPVEAVDWTLVATVPVRRNRNGLLHSTRRSEGARRSIRLAWFPEAGGFVETQVVDRQALAESSKVVGPAIIEDPDCTAVVLPGDVAELSDRANLIIKIALE